jgi:hypothetical protein
MLHLDSAGRAPPLDGEGLGRGDVSGKIAAASTFTPTLPSPIKGEGLNYFVASAGFT